MLRSLSDIQAFVQVAQELSFTKAAEALNMTPTAISKAVARLERDLGVALLTRTTRKVSMTAEGEVFLARCQAAFSEISSGIEAMEVMQDEATGQVSISAPLVFGPQLAANLPKLLISHPKLSLKLMITDAFSDLADEQVDIAIRVGEAPSANLTTHKLAQLNWATVASPQFLRANGTPASPEALNSYLCHSFINNAGQAVPWTFQTDGETWNLSPQNGIEVDQGQLLLNMALADGGIVQVFDFMVTDYIHNGQLVSLFKNHQAPGPTLYAIALSQKSSKPKIQITLSYIEKIFSNI